MARRARKRRREAAAAAGDTDQAGAPRTPKQRGVPHQHQQQRQEEVRRQQQQQVQHQQQQQQSQQKQQEVQRQQQEAQRQQRQQRRQQLRQKKAAARRRSRHGPGPGPPEAEQSRDSNLDEERAPDGNDARSDRETSGSGDGTSSEGEFEVEEILDVRTEPDGERRYLIRWKGYPDSENTWEPKANLNCDEKLKLFRNRLRERELQRAEKLRIEGISLLPASPASPASLASPASPAGGTQATPSEKKKRKRAPRESVSEPQGEKAKRSRLTPVNAATDEKVEKAATVGRPQSAEPKEPAAAFRKAPARLSDVRQPTPPGLQQPKAPARFSDVRQPTPPGLLQPKAPAPKNLFQTFARNTSWRLLPAADARSGAGPGVSATQPAIPEICPSAPPSPQPLVQKPALKKRSSKPAAIRSHWNNLSVVAEAGTAEKNTPTTADGRSTKEERHEKADRQVIENGFPKPSGATGANSASPSCEPPSAEFQGDLPDGKAGFPARSREGSGLLPSASPPFRESDPHSEPSARARLPGFPIWPSDFRLSALRDFATPCGSPPTLPGAGPDETLPEFVVPELPVLAEDTLAKMSKVLAAQLRAAVLGRFGLSRAVRVAKVEDADGDPPKLDVLKYLKTDAAVSKCLETRAFPVRFLMDGETAWRVGPFTLPDHEQPAAYLAFVPIRKDSDVKPLLDEVSELRVRHLLKKEEAYALLTSAADAGEALGFAVHAATPDLPAGPADDQKLSEWARWLGQNGVAAVAPLRSATAFMFNPAFADVSTFLGLDSSAERPARKPPLICALIKAGVVPAEPAHVRKESQYQPLYIQRSELPDLRKCELEGIARDLGIPKRVVSSLKDKKVAIYSPKHNQDVAKLLVLLKDIGATPFFCDYRNGLWKEGKLSFYTTEISFVLAHRDAIEFIGEAPSFVRMRESKSAGSSAPESNSAVGGVRNGGSACDGARESSSEENRDAVTFAYFGRALAIRNTKYTEFYRSGGYVVPSAVCLLERPEFLFEFVMFAEGERELRGCCWRMVVPRFTMGMLAKAAGAGGRGRQRAKQVNLVLRSLLLFKPGVIAVAGSEEEDAEAVPEDPETARKGEPERILDLVGRLHFARHLQARHFVALVGVSEFTDGRFNIQLLRAASVMTADKFQEAFSVARLFERRR